MTSLLLETDTRGVARLMLNRPDSGNALSAALIADLTEAAHMLAADISVRVIVITGTGEYFCKGGDLEWMQAQVTGDAASRRKAATALAMMLHALNGLPKPLIGRVNGSAFGGGVGLLSVCDVAIGTNLASFGLTETRLGLIPATIGPYVLARIGGAAARRYAMASRIFDATAAVGMGLLAAAVAPDALDRATEAELVPYLACAPGAVAEAKALFRSLTGAPDEAVIADTIERLVTRWESPEAADGIAAFFADRKPPWAQ